MSESMPGDSSGPTPDPANDPSPPQPPQPPPPSVYSEGLSYAQISARVPEKVAKGVFATGSLILHGAHELAIDFLLRLVPPPMLAARVVMPYGLLPSMIHALHENIEHYRARFAAPAPPPPPPAGFVPPKIQDIYDEMKLTEDVIVGCYANKLLITHSAGEFCFDFIFDLFPRPVVTCRVYMTAQQAPVLLETLKRTWAQVQQQQAQQQQQQQQQQQLPPTPPAPPKANP